MFKSDYKKCSRTLSIQSYDCAVISDWIVVQRQNSKLFTWLIYACVLLIFSANEINGALNFISGTRDVIYANNTFNWQLFPKPQFENFRRGNVWGANPGDPGKCL